MNLILEIFSVINGLIFLLLLIRQKIWCWLFGILSSVSSVWLFINLKLYSESILYAFYIVIGIYGWAVWYKRGDGGIVQTIKAVWHLVYIGIGVSVSLLLGYFFSTQTDAERSYADAFSTIFSFIASYLEAHKILSTWYYWICINAFSIWLYLDRGLQLYAGLMVLYFVMSVYGYISWRKSLNQTV